KSLPKKADFAIPFRRFQRVGPQAGNEFEDFGVRCDYRYRMTRKDVLHKNVDLIKYAASILKDIGAREARHDGSMRRLKKRPVHVINR
ncbi:MAG TPA: hypothetical protein VLJ17_14060, partial [Xanthobacteraceae bacterium]|nr:hypothetical protein [Xanthobacteraceae bacterium]